MTTKDNKFIKAEILHHFMRDVLQKAGVPEADANTCADVLIAADKRGIDSHGINRLKAIYYDRIKAGILNPITQIEIVKEGPATAVIDGHNGMGHVIAKYAMNLCIKKAKEFGIAMVTVRNSTHFGIAGYYPLMAVEHDMIGICGTNARPSIAPTFGVENMLGTNPLTFALPTDEAFPFLLDCATSISQRGKIEKLAKEGKETPEGWVIDRDGGTLTNSQDILQKLVSGKAALVSLGGIGEETAGYKGYGYTTVVEILSAALQGGNFLKMLSGFDAEGNKQPYNLGHFFIAINISSFIESEHFKKTTGTILRQLRNSQKAPGNERIYTAGEKEYLCWQERKEQGIPLNKKLQQEITSLIKELELSNYDFDF